MLLTPAHQRELQHASAQVGREHFDDAQVHVQSLKPRPGERGQQEVVQEEGSANTQPHHWVARQPAIQQEDQVEEEEGYTELYQDFGRNVPEQFPAQKKFVRIIIVNYHGGEVFLIKVKFGRPCLYKVIDSYSNERYVSKVTARKTAEIPQPM